MGWPVRNRLSWSTLIILSETQFRRSDMLVIVWGEGINGGSVACRGENAKMQVLATGCCMMYRYVREAVSIKIPPHPPQKLPDTASKADIWHMYTHQLRLSHHREKQS